MRKWIYLTLLLIFPSTALADGLTLRDAVYIYNQSFDAKGSNVLVGVDCDVFKVVLDVKSGFSDLAMAEADSLDAALVNQTAYPDRIVDVADMFAYSLYQDKSIKTFIFKDKNNPAADTQIGSGTVFGYCYSANPNAYVYLKGASECKYNGFPPRTEPIADCVANNASKGSANIKLSTDWLNGKSVYRVYYDTTLGKGVVARSEFSSTQVATVKIYHDQGATTSTLEAAPAGYVLLNSLIFIGAGCGSTPSHLTVNYYEVPDSATFLPFANYWFWDLASAINFASTLTTDIPPCVK